MKLRIAAFAMAAVATLHAGAAAAQSRDFEDRISGGAPLNKVYSLFGFSPVSRSNVNYASREAAGTIIINTKERRLYYILGEGRAIQYGIGVGRPGFTWAGVKTITEKKEWPSWTPPPQMLKRRPDLPRFMPGGEENPLGARAMYLGSTLYRIHGSNEPETIGQAVSSGCFRMTNGDVKDLYDRVRVGTRVVIMQ